MGEIVPRPQLAFIAYAGSPKLTVKSTRYYNFYGYHTDLYPTRNCFASKKYEFLDKNRYE